MKTKIKLLLGSGGAALASLSLTGVAFAANNINLKPGGFENITGANLNSMISGAVKLLLLVAFVIAFIFLLIGGIRWILSGGDKAAAEAARGTLTAAIIGLVIVLAAWAIMWFIEQLFGVQIVSGTIGIPNLY